MSFAPEALRRDPLERTALRVAGLFAIVVAVLLLGSSVLLYASFTRDIHDVYDLRIANEAREREVVADAIWRLRLRVIATDAVLFAAVGALGLWYARRTLRPVREALENQRRFIADASHELRTPLAIMKADLEVARRGQPDTEALAAAIDSGLEEVDRMSGMVADLLTLSRIDAREERLSIAPVDLAALVKASTGKLDAYAAEQGVSIAFDGDRGPVMVEADADALQRVLFNLMRNATQHSPAGESVTVRLARDDDRAQIVVTDRGPGMTARELERVFDRFYSSAPGSSGLGLPIARWIVEAHGGRLKLTSEEGAGTTATIVLPLPGSAR